ncbi:hypothetical protein CR513_58960, partial [Mucuna pruriens]
MIGWVIELSEFDIIYERMGHIKAQVLADFINELTPNSGKEEAPWRVRDGCYLLTGPPTREAAKRDNNQAKYEAFLEGIRLVRVLGATRLIVKSDSQLVIGQVNDEYQARDHQAQDGTFEGFTLLHVPREQNEKVDLLAKLASM